MKIRLVIVSILLLTRSLLTDRAISAPAASPEQTAAVPPAVVQVAPSEVKVTQQAVSSPSMEKPTSGMPVAQVKAPTNAPVLLAPPAEDDRAIPGAKASTNVVNKDLISVTLDDVDMVDVVRMFTRISGANIITTPTNLQGRVSVNLTDVEWKPALESILEMNKLALTERTPGSKVYSIVVKPEGQPEPQLVDTFALKYASVSNVTGVVVAMLAPNGKVSAFPSRNTLVVRTTAANLGEIKQIIEKIDRMRQQVFIEAKFMELNDEAIKDLGIDWQVLQGYNLKAQNLSWTINQTTDSKQTSDQWSKKSTVDTLQPLYDVNGQQIQQSTPSITFTTDPSNPNGPAIQTVQNTITPTRTVVDTIDQGKNLESTINNDLNQVKTAVLGLDDFKLMLSALKQMNGVSIVSNPKIIVANEEAATIHIGDVQRPFIASVTPGQQGIAPVITYNPGEKVEFGVILTVTPTVNTESNITVKIEPELTRLEKYDVAPNGQTYPIVGTKKISTVFCIESGKTVAIGGLTETSDTENTDKIPLLGDIPLLGKYLFSHTHKDKNQQETIIFVTVGLAEPEGMIRDDGLPEDTELVRRKTLESEVKRKEFLEELDKQKQAIQAEQDKKNKKDKARLIKMGE